MRHVLGTRIAISLDITAVGRHPGKSVVTNVFVPSLHAKEAVQFRLIALVIVQSDQGLVVAGLIGTNQRNNWKVRLVRRCSSPGP